MASRLLDARGLSETFNRIVAKNSVPAWQFLFDFARQCFLKPRTGGKKTKSLASVSLKSIARSKTSLKTR